MSDCPKEVPSLRASRCFDSRAWPRISPVVTNPGGESLVILTDDDQDPLTEDTGELLILQPEFDI